MRTVDTQANDLQNKSNRSVHENGLKNQSCLNELKYFNTINGLPPDIMHDLLEGVIRYNFCILIQHLTDEKKYSPKQLNEDLNSFKYGRIDKQNRMNCDLFTEKSSYKISATHMWLLLRVFPLMCGEKLKDDVKYKHFIELLHIFRDLNDESYDENKIKKLELDIENYLKNFKKHYPTNRIIPKQHFLIHYPSTIRKFGPPRSYSTIRFEAKHSYFKQVNNATHNHINLLKSLAYRHQYLQVYHLSSSSYFKPNELGSCNLDKTMSDFVGLELKTKNFILINWIKWNGIKYATNDLVVFNRINDLPVVGAIKSLVYLIKLKSFRLVVDEFQTLQYVDYLASYQIKQMESRLKIVEIIKLLSPWPLDLYELRNSYYLIPKYPI